MPFLRNKRGNMASNAELRRSTMFLDDSPADPAEPAEPAEPSLRRTVSSHIDLPALRLSPTTLSADVDAAADAVALAANGLTPAIPAPPVTPPHDSPSSPSAADKSATLRVRDPIDRPDSPPIQDETPKHRRFSMLRFRNASDSQLSARAKKQALAHVDESAPPPVPRAMLDAKPRSAVKPTTAPGDSGSTAPPEIITTAPTVEMNTVPRKQSRMFGRLRRSGEEMRNDRTEPAPPIQGLSKKDRRKSFIPMTGKKSISIEEPEPRRPKSSNAHPSRPDEPPPPLPLPGTRLSESSRSEESSGSRLHGNSNTPGQNGANTFFRFPKRKPKQPEPLFPLAHLQKQRSNDQCAPPTNQTLAPATPVRQSTSSTTSGISPQHTLGGSRNSTAGNGISTPTGASPARALFQKTNNASPATALFRPLSRNSGASSPTRLNVRGRSSTMSSLGREGRESLDDRLAPPYPRNSTSTGGRKSFGDLLGISRLRNHPESSRQGTGTPATPGSNTSKDNSLNIQRESVVLPEKREDENPGRYLERIEDIASRSALAAALSKHGDPFHLAVLRSFMRKFGFFGDPMDMAIRKLLMSAELPKETQHIDRFLQAFANRYHECNPGIYTNPDQAYFIAFSLLILHTDVFNKNNKHKMQKQDYLKNTKGEGIADEVLEVFYDNITYTPFIHVEDELDLNGDRPPTQKASKKKSVFPTPGTPEAIVKKASKEPIDPYTLILDNRLDILRPNLKEVMVLEDHFSYLGTAPSLNLKELQKTFFRTGILQIVSARSRPDAFMSEKTATNPQEAQPGVVDIKVTKVGLLWRKDVKKKKTRSPWQEWGAILTGAQLYFFRNTAWIKNLMHQYETHIKQGHDGIPIIFKPPLESFKPDALMSTDGAVALLDSTYKKHKHAFVYVRHGGLEEVLLADNEEEMNDWLGKLNYAAAFRTNGVRMRGVIGGSYDGQGRRALRRLDTESVQTPSGEVMIARSKVDQQMAHDILFARREIMFHKVAEANETLQQEEKKLDEELRNARHIQLLAPIQPKTRDALLMSAARMAAMLKWSRINIWKIKCHRDILLLDLEEERQMLGLQAGPVTDALSPVKAALGREISKTSKASSGTVIASATGPVISDSQRDPPAETVPQASDDESATADTTFATPPASSGLPSLQKDKSSWSELRRDRKASMSSTKSAAHMSVSMPATPPRTTASPTSGPESAVADEEHPEDANERHLLEKTGLLVEDGPKSPESVDRIRTMDTEQTSDRMDHGPHSNSTDKDKSDKNKIRRSLQRTLREGAGHLSHARSRKGKEPAHGVSTEDNTEAEMLTRGTGPFVVHGKKASVITFGSELQSLSPDERLLRARKTSPTEGSMTNGEAGDEAAAVNSAGTSHGDFRVFLLTNPERRTSAASASTATARSFRELHRKYSSAAKSSPSLGGLVVPVDEDSDAISFSDGRRTPLPPEQVEEVEEEHEQQQQQQQDDGVDEKKTDGEEAIEDEEEVEEFHSATMNKARETLFFTPEPPESPRPASSVTKESEKEEQHQREQKNEDKLPSPTVPVSV